MPTAATLTCCSRSSAIVVVAFYALLGAGRASTLRCGRQDRCDSAPACGGGCPGLATDRGHPSAGADAMVGRDGRLRYLALPPRPNARPPLDELIAALD